ncbi:MAG: energy transducer TonB [Prevotella sp.]
MEIKKSKHADLSRKRPAWFLLGLVFVLASLYAALEYTVGPDYLSDEDELLEDMSLDMNMFPMADREEMAVIEKGQAERPSPDKIKVVEEDVVQTVDAEEKDEESDTDGKPGIGEETELPTEELKLDEKPLEEPLDYTIVEQLPQFPGGMGAFVRWLSSNLKYPPVARQKNIQGRVTVTFIINTDGSVSDAKVSAACHPLLDGEAMRVVRLMPKWTPGTDKGKPCRTLFAIPIVFKI